MFMALLFLAQLQKVKLWQKQFPHGEIFVKRLSTEETIAADELLAIPALAHPKGDAARASSPGVGA